MFDWGIKSLASYGEKSFDEILTWAKAMKFTSLSITDLFSVSHNKVVIDEQMSYISGSEFFCKLGSERVDIIFVGFGLTPGLLRFEKNFRKVLDFNQKKFLEDAAFADSWFRPEEFGKTLNDEAKKRAYMNLLPDFDMVASEFIGAGARIILDRIPFTSNKSDRFKLVKRIAEKDLWGTVVFRDVANYNDENEEVGEALDICTEMDVLPIVASGIYSNYDTWEILGADAQNTFSWLGEEVLRRLADD